MRTTVSIILAVVIGIGSAACKKDKAADKGSEGSGSGSAAMAGSGDMAGSGSGAAMAGSGAAMAGSGSGAAMAGSGSGDMAGSGSGAAMAGSGDTAGSGSAAAAGDEPEMAKKAGNCPSTVLGAVTKAEIKGKDVVLTITSNDKDAIAAIQKRAEEVVKDRKDKKDAGTAHDQKGTHGGTIGLCPVYFGEGGTAKVKKDAKGVTITITPKGKADELKANIDERIKKSAEWVEKNIKPGAEGNKGAVGGGKGEHGSTHQGEGDSKGKDRKGGTGGGAGTGGGGGKGTGGGGSGDKKGG